jgi:protein-arginine kinase activator protein McsA
MSHKTTGNIGFEEGELAVHPKDAQRADFTRPGKYLCEKCNTAFHFRKTDKLECPNCENDNQDTLTAIYTEEDPHKDELLGKDEFSAGD